MSLPFGRELLMFRGRQLPHNFEELTESLVNIFVFDEGGHKITFEGNNGDFLAVNSNLGGKKKILIGGKMTSDEMFSIVMEKIVFSTGNQRGNGASMNIVFDLVVDKLIGGTVQFGIFFVIDGAEEENVLTEMNDVGKNFFNTFDSFEIRNDGFGVN